MELFPRSYLLTHSPTYTTEILVVEIQTFRSLSLITGKTTLLDTLRGRLPLLNGERVEDSNLRLGVFTQDLAQELDVSRRAVDLVTEYARSGDDGNIFISDQEARNILGGLGLQGEKALRKVGQLSGGEKARVALAQFALKPSNLYLLDEVSNHLDIEWYVVVCRIDNMIRLWKVVEYTKGRKTGRKNKILTLLLLFLFDFFLLLLLFLSQCNV